MSSLVTPTGIRSHEYPLVNRRLRQLSLKERRYVRKVCVETHLCEYSYLSSQTSYSWSSTLNRVIWEETFRSCVMWVHYTSSLNPLLSFLSLTFE